LDSAKLVKVLEYYTQTNYKGVFLEKIFSSFKFNEKQKSMSQALYSHGLWRKLSNYILADVQKAKKETFLYSYPYWLVVDPCNYCQLSCPFCPTGQKRNVRKKAKLSFADFKAIMDKLGPYLIHIDLVNWGEPLLNEDIFRMIKYAKGFHCDIKLDSNLNSLNEDSAEEMVLSGLDKIVVSIDGLTEETYSKYRVGGNFKLAMDNLKLLIKKRQKLKSRKPYITWQFLVFRHNEHEIEQAQRMGRDLGVDHVGITKAFIGDKNWIPLNTQYSNYNLEEIKGELTYDSFKVKQDAFCHWPWEAITINPNGTISACCSVEEEKDDFGNIFDESIEYLWNNQKYISARDYIKDKKNGEALDNNICFSCRHLGLINIDILSCHSFFDTL
jgi:radical SAM protein with 4Fe4S-binding SPASM domain